MHPSILTLQASPLMLVQAGSRRFQLLAEDVDRSLVLRRLAEDDEDATVPLPMNANAFSAWLGAAASRITRAEAVFEVVQVLACALQMLHTCPAVP